MRIIAGLILCAGLASAADCLTPREICRLKPGAGLSGSKYVLTAVDQKSIEALRRAIRLEDKDGIKELVVAGKIFSTSEGDKIKIFDVSVSGGWIEGRMETGEFTGARVWAFREWVVK